MDLETLTAFEAIREDIRGLERRVELRIERTEMTVRAEFRREIRESSEETRRHFDIVAESLRDDIRMLAEGLVSLDAKVESIRSPGSSR